MKSILKPLTKLLSLAPVTLLVGCAVGVTHQLDGVSPVIYPAAKTSSLSLAVHDQRPYIVSGQKPKTFVGVSRGGFGNPFDVNTTSGKPLTDDISGIIRRALEKNDTKVDVIEVTPLDQEKSVMDKLLSKHQKAILVSIAEWKSDTYMSVTLHYDLTLSVIEADGRLGAMKRIHGVDLLGSSGVNPPELSRRVVPAALKEKIEQLFSAPEVAKQL